MTDPQASWVDLGRTRYEPVHRLQRAVVRARSGGTLSQDVVLATEHEPVLTMGRGGDPRNVLDADLPVHEIERGGDVTYHGPGQLVLYPCFRLEGKRRDLHAWLRDLEEVVIATLRAFSLAGRREDGKTGVWVDGFKVASIGVAVSRWVTYHGIGLNVTTDLSNFHKIRPCGLESGVMRSMNDLATEDVSVREVREVCRKEFERRFETSFEPRSLSWLLERLEDPTTIGSLAGE